MFLACFRYEKMAARVNCKAHRCAMMTTTNLKSQTKRKAPARMLGPLVFAYCCRLARPLVYAPRYTIWQRASARNSKRITWDTRQVTRGTRREL